MLAGLTGISAELNEPVCLLGRLQWRVSWKIVRSFFIWIIMSQSAADFAFDSVTALFVSQTG